MHLPKEPYLAKTAIKRMKQSHSTTTGILIIIISTSEGKIELMSLSNFNPSRIDTYACVPVLLTEIRICILNYKIHALQISCISL